jgi:hypothetical protein
MTPPPLLSKSSLFISWVTAANWSWVSVPQGFLWRRPSSLITDNGNSDIVQNKFQENAVVHLRQHKCCYMRAEPTVWSALGHLVDLTGR